MSLDEAFSRLGMDRNMDDGSIDVEAKRAYRRLAQKAHPDKGGSTEEFQRLGEAYERVCSRNESPFGGMGGFPGGGMPGGLDPEELLRQMFGGMGGGGGGMPGGFAFGGGMSTYWARPLQFPSRPTSSGGRRRT